MMVVLKLKSLSLLVMESDGNCIRIINDKMIGLYFIIMSYTLQQDFYSTLKKVKTFCANEKRFNNLAG